MPDITLPERLRPPFMALSKAVLSVFPEGTVAMGGGSLLEALWSHRTSTDLDLFISPRNLGMTFDLHRGYLHHLFSKSLQDEGIGINVENRTAKRDAMFVSGECADGTPWSLAEMHYMHPDVPLLHLVEGTGIRAATLTEIFMGKVLGRAFKVDHERTDGKEPIPIRDCYDICVCANREPDILRGIFKLLSTENRGRLAENFRNAPKDLQLRDNKPIINPSWSVPLKGIAQRIGEAVAANDIGLIPAAGRLDVGALGKEAGQTPKRRNGPCPT